MDWLARLPFTLIFLLAMFAANAAAGTLSGKLPFRALTEWGLSHHRLLRGEASRLITGTFLSHDRGMFARQIIFAAGAIGYYEWQLGTLQTALMFSATNIAGIVIVLFLVLPRLREHLPFARPLHQLDVGMSAGGFGLVGAILVTLPGSAALLMLALAGIFLKMRVKFDAIADSAHLICLILGFCAQLGLNYLYPITQLP